MVNPRDPLYATFLKVINKHKGFNLIRRQDFITKEGGDVAGNSLAIGNPGYCKTSGNKREVELRWAVNHKIFCLYDGGDRMDMCYFMFPSVSSFWKKPKIRTTKFRRKIIIGRRDYPVEVLIPVTKDIPKKLPNNFVPFSIAVSDLDKDDLVALLGGRFEDTIDAAYNYMLEKVNEETTPLDYIKILESAWKIGDPDGVKLSYHGPKKLIESAFNPLMNQGLLTSKKLSTVLDLKTILKDKKNISVLVLRHCQKSFHGFLVHYFMNHIHQLLSGRGTTKKIKQKTTIVENEISDLLSKDTEEGSSAYSISKMISRIAKQYRTASLFLLLDTQLPGELPELKETMKRVYVYNSSLPSVLKAMAIAGISEYAGDINQDDYSIIPRLSKGWYYLFDRDAGVSIHKLEWCRSRTYLDGENFYDIYDKVFGKTAYQDISLILEEIKKEKERSKEIWEYKKKITAPKLVKIRKRKKEEIDIEEEEEEIIEEEREKEVDWKAFAKAVRY